jgi:sigma-B regulation protein RsbU (phosphoserine phosphatase)
MNSETSGKIIELEGEIGRLKSAVEELTVLNDLAIAASTSLEVDEMLDIIVQKSIKAVKAEQGSILLVTELQDAPLQTLIRQAAQKSRIMTYKVGINITGWVLAHQQPLIIENLATDPRFQTTEQERKEIRSVLCVPIRFKGQLLGLLTVTNKQALAPFSEGDLRLLCIIAAQSGQLIRNSQLQKEALEKKRLEQELSVARRIQMALLPKKLPAARGLEIATYFNPADSVGGDYYDYFSLADEQLGIVVADVSGHGPSAALMMTMIKGILHSIAGKFESPEGVLAEMNTILSRIAPEEMFVTMLLVVVDLKKRLMVFSNAGHNPLLYYDRESLSCRLVELAGPALGISEQPVFQKLQMPLRPGDAFLMYTDGVTEAFNPQGEMFESSRLLQTLAETASEPAGKIVDHLKNKLLAFINHAPPSDDVAMFAMKITQ